MIWGCLLVLQYAIIVIGIATQCVLLNFLVLKPVLQSCARNIIAIQSVSMVYVLLFFGAETLVCLVTGSMFEDKICIAQTGKHILLSIRDYFQMVIVQSHLTFTIERLISIKLPIIHKNPAFKTYFHYILLIEQVFALIYTYTNNFQTEKFGLIWLFVFHFIIIVNWPIVFYTKKTCRNLYKADVQIYDLKRKHELYKSYEITKSLLNAIVFNATQQIITFVFVGLQLGGLLFPKEDYYKTLFILHIIWNSNFIVYSLVLLFSHRSSRRKILAIEPKVSITSIDGTDITQRPTQKDHFRELKVAWS